jgi:hypothetical protein
VNSFKSGITAGTTGDWATLGAAASTIVGKGLIYFIKQNKALEDITKAAIKKNGLPTPTAIVDAAAFAIALVDLLNGFGSPNSGSAVSTAKDKFALFTTSLDPGCIPDPRDWSGTAATAYTDQVTTLKNFVTTMNGYDQELKGHLADQAAQIKQAHLTCTVNVAVLTAAAGIALILYVVPFGGPAASQAWQIIAAFACIAATFVVEMLTLSGSMGTSNKLSSLGQKYVQLGKDVDSKLKGSFGKIEGKVAAESSSKLSAFHGISDGLSSFSFAGITVSKLADQSGDKVSSEQKTLLSDSNEKAAAAAKTDTPAKTGDKAATGTPAATTSFTPPTMAQMGQMSQGLNQFGQTLSQGAQQISQLAQQAKGAAPAAAAAATPAHDVSDVKGEDGLTDEEREKKKKEEADAAGAASGTGGTERAPVDAAAPAAAAAAPGGRERVL